MKKFSLKTFVSFLIIFSMSFEKGGARACFEREDSPRIALKSKRAKESVKESDQNTKRQAQPFKNRASSLEKTKKRKIRKLTRAEKRKVRALRKASIKLARAEKRRHWALRKARIRLAKAEKRKGRALSGARRRESRLLTKLGLLPQFQPTPSRQKPARQQPTVDQSQEERRRVQEQARQHQGQQRREEEERAAEAARQDQQRREAEEPAAEAAHPQAESEPAAETGSWNGTSRVYGTFVPGEEQQGQAQFMSVLNERPLENPLRGKPRRPRRTAMAIRADIENGWSGLPLDDQFKVLYNNESKWERVLKKLKGQKYSADDLGTLRTWTTPIGTLSDISDLRSAAGDLCLSQTFLSQSQAQEEQLRREEEESPAAAAAKGQDADESRTHLPLTTPEGVESLSKSIVQYLTRVHTDTIQGGVFTLSPQKIVEALRQNADAQGYRVEGKKKRLDALRRQMRGHGNSPLTFNDLIHNPFVQFAEVTQVSPERVGPYTNYKVRVHKIKDIDFSQEDSEFSWHTCLYKLTPKPDSPNSLDLWVMLYGRGLLPTPDGEIGIIVCQEEGEDNSKGARRPQRQQKRLERRPSQRFRDILSPEVMEEVMEDLAGPTKPDAWEEILDLMDQPIETRADCSADLQAVAAGLRESKLFQSLESLSGSLAMSSRWSSFRSHSTSYRDEGHSSEVSSMSGISTVSSLGTGSVVGLNQLLSSADLAEFRGFLAAFSTKAEVEDH